jgi:predicted transcriptional regulator of viral defense system
MNLAAPGPMKKRYLIAEAIFQQQQGILRFSEAQRLGITGSTISEMTAAKLLVKESKGVYRLATQASLAYPDFVTLALRAPLSVICLTSALHFFQLTTQIPRQVYVALPRNRTKAPRINYPPLHVITLSQKAYSVGIESHSLDGVPVNFYSPEKTLADCFKFRNLIGQDVALEALKTYFAEHKPNISAILNYAKIDRVEKIIRPYLELFR